jgi:hypothetical protein
VTPGHGLPSVSSMSAGHGLNRDLL